MKYLIKYIFLFQITVMFLGCRKFVDIAPPANQLIGSSVYSSNSNAASALNGIYATMISSPSVGGGTMGISSLLTLAADDAKLNPTTNKDLNQIYTNQILSTSNIPFWKELYNVIYQANSAIDGISKSAGVTPAMKLQLIGEAKFIRAFSYFYLNNIYGNVPLILTTNYSSNLEAVRAEQPAISHQLVADLRDAESALSNNYVNTNGVITTDRIRPNKGAAAALLARVYLYQQQWDSAVILSTSVINQSAYKLSNDLNNTFLATNNSEAIWQLQIPNTGFNTLDGSAFLSGYLSGSGPSSTRPLSLSDSLINQFEADDLRKAHWTVARVINGKTYYFSYKYKLGNYTGLPATEYMMVLRFAEQLLIRAEARLHLGNLAGSVEDLDSIRSRAGLVPVTAMTSDEISRVIEKERRSELFTEYGHRWFDLNRLGKLDSVMNIITPLKGGLWNGDDKLFPLPLYEIQNNPSLVQNPGYN
jgi:starch-binding outer membrane protein, SusD/RagB family